MLVIVTLISSTLREFVTSEFYEFLPRATHPGCLFHLKHRSSCDNPCVPTEKGFFGNRESTTRVGYVIIYHGRKSYEGLTFWFSAGLDTLPDHMVCKPI